MNVMGLTLVPDGHHVVTALTEMPRAIAFKSLILWKFPVAIDAMASVMNITARFWSAELILRSSGDVPHISSFTETDFLRECDA